MGTGPRNSYWSIWNANARRRGARFLHVAVKRLNSERGRGAPLEEEDPHNYRAVGWSMVAVAAGLAGIGLMALFIGDDVLYSDNFQRAKTAEFEHCKTINFEGNMCDKYLDRINTPISGVFTDGG